MSVVKAFSAVRKCKGRFLKTIINYNSWYVPVERENKPKSYLNYQ